MTSIKGSKWICKRNNQIRFLEVLSFCSGLSPVAVPLRCAIFPLRHHVQLSKLCIGNSGRGPCQQALARRRLRECNDVPDGSRACSTSARSLLACTYIRAQGLTGHAARLGPHWGYRSHTNYFDLSHSTVFARHPPL